MLTRLFHTPLLFVIAVSMMISATHLIAADSDAPQKPKNVILMIGDGMSFNHYVSGSYWRYGELGRQNLDSFPVHCGVTTAQARTVTPVPDNYPCYKPEWFWGGPKTINTGTELTDTTDSAAAATALNTGVKTKGGRMGMSTDEKPLKKAAEVANKNGKATGAISTVQTCHATPGAVWVAFPSRNQYVEIFNFMVRESGLDVIMGAGHPHYSSNGKPVAEDKVTYDYVGGKDTWDEIVANRTINGFDFIETRQEFEQLANPTAALPKKVLGIARAGGTIFAFDGAPDSCPADAAVADKVTRSIDTNEQPTLSIMSLGALNVLSQNKNGFYIMIEGGYIDGAAHGNNAEGVVYEVTGFTKAIDAVIDWVEKNSSWDETLLIVTADHETGMLWGGVDYVDTDGDGKFDAARDEFKAYLPIESNGCGKLPKMAFYSGGHSNALVPLWAKGVGAEGIKKYFYGKDEKAGQWWGFSGDYIDNTHVGRFIMEQLAP
ncbi:MAG: alkaline phosphatase [Planctomycetaceae bacterium]|nr:alkaline phosphatase [Planctomycetaceae bacterium]